MAKLTPEIAEQAREMRACGVGWHTASKRTGISEYILRRELEPHFMEHRRAQGRRYTAKKKTAAIVRAKRVAERKRASAVHTVSALDRVPPETLLERERHQAALERRSLSETLLGDPPEGWRALDQRGKG